MKITVHSILGGFPTQLEGTTAKGEPVYVRYRHGELSMHVGNPGETVDQMLERDCDGTEVFSRDDGTGNGMIDLQEIQKAIPEHLFVEALREGKGE